MVKSLYRLILYALIQSHVMLIILVNTLVRNMTSECGRKYKHDMLIYEGVCKVVVFWKCVRPIFSGLKQEKCL